jgi:hypothetical protein
MIKLLVKEIEDDRSRENFKRIQKEFTENQIILKGQWRFFELIFTGAVTNFKQKHLLTFVPKDIIQTSIIGAGTLTWNYSLFDRENLDITTTGACTVRAFVGRYEEGAGQL